MTTIAIVTLGRTKANGEARRVESWRRIIEASGREAAVVNLVRDHRATPTSVLRQLPALRRSMPETLAWSAGALCHTLQRVNPDAVIAVTGRAHAANVAKRWPTILDLVDRLSVSYADRARRLGGMTIVYELLAWRARRFEAANGRGAVAAGRDDAAALGAEWVPNIATDEPMPSVEPTWDLVFVGTLDYQPNIEAVVRLDRMWPHLQRARADTTLLLAGARPTDSITRAASKNGWQVLADFHSLADVLPRARVAVAPLVHASGIQNKVLDAAAAGMPQVVSTVVAGGLDPDFPVRVADDDESFVREVVELLHDPATADAEGERARAHVGDLYAPPRWAAWLEEWLSAR